jgi:hypothetical protein
MLTELLPKSLWKPDSLVEIRKEIKKLFKLLLFFLIPHFADVANHRKQITHDVGENSHSTNENECTH